MRSGTSASFYINGTLVGTQTAATNVYWSSSNLNMFSDNAGSDEPQSYTGYVGNVALLNTALSQSQVASVFAASASAFSAAATLPAAPPAKLAACASVTNSYAFDLHYMQGAAEVRDLAGSMAATVVGNATFGSDTIGAVGSAGFLSFDGTSTYVQLGGYVTIGPPLTVALWVKTRSSASSWARFFDFSTGAHPLHALRPAGLCARRPAADRRRRCHLHRLEFGQLFGGAYCHRRCDHAGRPVDSLAQHTILNAPPPIPQD